MIADALASLFSSRGHVIGEDDDEALILTGGLANAAGERVSPGTALTVPAFFGGVSLISSGVRAMPMRVLHDAGDGVLLPDRSSRLWALLHDQPNPEQHADELWEWMTLCLLLRGDAFAWISRFPDGRVQWLRPLNPRRVVVARDARTRRKIFLVFAADDREQVQFVGTTDDILHVKGFGTDPLVGASVLWYLREAIGRSIAEDRKSSSTLRNNGRPGGILKVPGRLDDIAATKLKDRWQAAHGGRRAGGTAVLEEGAEWQSVEASAADMELVKQRVISREDFAVALQIPGDMLLAGSQAGLHYSSDASRDVRLVKHAIMPWAKRIQDALEICELLPWGATGGKPGRLLPRFNPAGLLKTDIKTRYEAHKVGIDAGFIAPNEARATEDLVPLTGLDRTRPLTSPATTEKRSQ